MCNSFNAHNHSIKGQDHPNLSMNNTISKSKLDYNSFIHKEALSYFMRDHQSHLVPCFNHPTTTYYHLNHDLKQMNCRKLCCYHHIGKQNTSVAYPS
jgi:hypothetical protein